MAESSYYEDDARLTDRPPVERPERCDHRATAIGSLYCDRERGHEGPHRGYLEQQDEVVFWPRDADA